ncbi:MAG: DUF1028 domain-containing protein [Alphaproteobacteria bacterium]|nr:DUF1028 domain-containing protein [Alphaproteobacteria bacterium]
MLLLATLLSAPAYATWSIVAVDPETGDVGAAGATCGPFVWKIAQVVPGHGAVVAQYDTSISARKDAAVALEDGATPEEALAGITAPGYDDDLAVRQYAVAGLAGPAAAFTGDDCADWNGERVEEHVAIVGNTLVGEAVVDAARDAFFADEGALLEERLLAALEAGAAEGGDQRCDPEDAAKSAFLFVAAEGDDGLTVELTASGAGAVATLRDKVDAGKRQSCHCGAANPSGSWAWLAVLGLAFTRRRTG